MRLRPSGALVPPASAPRPALLGSLFLLALWQTGIGLSRLGNGTIPTPIDILTQMMTDGPALYATNALDTLRSAAQGWLWGNALGIVLAVVALLVPVLERFLLGIGVVSLCLPVVAIGPVLAIVLSGDAPRIVLSALCVMFTTQVAATLGLRSADPAALELLHVFGGRPSHRLTKVRVWAALPSLLAGMRVAAPASILGSIVGELLGADNGLGVLLIDSQQALNYARTWGVIVVATLVASGGYAATALLARVATPWAQDTQVNLAAHLGGTGDELRRGTSGSIASRLGEAVLFVLAALIAWWAFLRLTGVSPFIGKGPLDVWAYLTAPSGSADNRAALVAEAIVSFRDGTIGLVAGTTAAVTASGVLSVWPALRRVLIGPAMALQSMPLIAITPVIVLIFGRGLTTVAVVGSVVCFFPMLVNVTLALARVPHGALDLARVYGASPLAILLKVRLPSALPSLFASLRLAAPLAVTGAMLAEWLATGQGLGYAILQATVTSDYDGLWARVVIAVILSLSLYWLIGLIERAVHRLFVCR
ncbi:MAG: ABC transporter permease [Janthinobacterium lividum]